jgi:hypothetical protein
VSLPAFSMEKPVIGGARPRAMPGVLFLQLAFERLDFLGERGVVSDKMFDFADGDVVAASKRRPISGSEPRASVLLGLLHKSCAHYLTRRPHKHRAPHDHDRASGHRPKMLG